MDVNYEEINSFIKHCDEMISWLLIDTHEYLKELPAFTDHLSSFIKSIISTYSSEKMLPYIEDAKYWMDLYKRILNSISAKDVINTADLLQFEMKFSLNEYLNIINKN